MQTFALSLIHILVAMGGLAMGVLLRREPLRGSCGGVACAKGSACPCRADQAERGS